MTQATDRQECLVEVERDVHVWVESIGDPDGSPLLLVMGANASGLAWPNDLVARLSAHHRVLRYDHRDTGRSTTGFAERPYSISTLARDALAVLDAHDFDRAHLVGMSLGGTLVQLLMLDAPERLLSATLLGTSALEADPPAEGASDLPGPSDEVMAMWEHLADQRDREADIAWHVEHWRVLAGAAAVGAFDAEEFRALEERIRHHSGRDQLPTAHARADQSGLCRGAELSLVRVPTLVIDAPLDPVVPPPHARHLAAQIPGARLVTIPTMGHALPIAVLEQVAAAVLSLTADPLPQLRHLSDG